MPASSLYFATVLREILSPCSDSMQAILLSLRGEALSSLSTMYFSWFFGLQGISSSSHSIVFEKKYVSGNVPHEQERYLPFTARKTVDSWQPNAAATSFCFSLHRYSGPLKKNIFWQRNISVHTRSSVEFLF